MHAFLFIGSGAFDEAISRLSKKLQAKILEFPLIKIEDVRDLNNLIRLSFNEPTLIISQNIHEAGEEALNAFLKNLEEPQENIYFALTAPTTRKVLPTIVSRCEIIRIKNQESGIWNEKAEQFMKMTIGEKLAFIDKIKDRSEAIELTENLVNFFHSQVHSEKVSYGNIAKNIEIASLTRRRLKGNGNVALQLTNLVINLV